MAGTVTIKHLRNIEELVFPVPDTGVWLLTGGNGSGKTSLLACLRRIGNANAFPTHFPSSNESEALDNYTSASITYALNEEEVVYSYKTERWTPLPRRNSKLLGNFGYPAVIYIGATADRITPRPEDFDPSKVRRVSDQLINAANLIFETTKFSELRTIRLRGTGTSAFVLRTKPSPNPTYHSETQFSLGELCILKLIKSIIDCYNQSFILIDELEMALHPRAQVQLYKFLVETAQKKKLTIIFSTHSVTLIKFVPRRNLIFLQRLGNIVEAIVGCFPTYALGNITFGEERAPDRAIYVEDEPARTVTEALAQIFLKSKYSGVNHFFPSFKVVPIGSFESVVRFLDQSQAIITTSGYALLDADVKSESYAQWKSTNNLKQISLFDKVKDNIKYLPWTPEVGFVRLVRDDRDGFERRIKTLYSDQKLIVAASDFPSIEGLVGSDCRKKCKALMASFVQKLAKQIPCSEEKAGQDIWALFALAYFEKEREKVMSLFGPMLS